MLTAHLRTRNTLHQHTSTLHCIFTPSKGSSVLLKNLHPIASEAFYLQGENVAAPTLACLLANKGTEQKCPERGSSWSLFRAFSWPTSVQRYSEQEVHGLVADQQAKCAYMDRDSEE
jgi:hypothetical protein